MDTIGEAFVKIRPDAAGFAGETKSKVGGTLKDIAKLAAGALAVGGATDFLVDAVKNASAFQERMSAVDQTLKSSGQGTDEAKKKAENYVDALSKLSGFAKGDVAAALQRADQGTQNLGKAMQVETIAANLARSRHADLAQTTLLVTKAFAGNTTGLKRLGISFDPVTAAQDRLKDSIRALQAKIADETGATKKADQARLVALKSTKDSAVAADKTATGLAVQARLAKIAEGGMKAYGETTAGKVAKAKNAIEDLQIEIGTALLPIIGRLADIGTKEIERLQKGWPEIKKEAEDAIKPLVPIFDTIRTVIEDVVGDLGGAKSAIKDVGIAIAAFVIISKTIQLATIAYEAMTTAIFLARNAQAALDVALEANPIGLIVVALAALAAGIYLAYTRSATFRQIVQGAFGVLKTDVLPALQTVEKAIADFVTYIRSHWSQITGIVGPVVRAAFALIKGYVQAPLDYVKGLINLFGDVIHGRWSNIWGDLIALVTKPLGDIKTAVTTALGDLAPLAEKAAEFVATEIVRAIKTAPSKLEGLAGDLLSKIKAAIGQVAGDAEAYGEKVGVQIAEGVVKGLAGLPGKIAGAIGGALPGGNSAVQSAVAKAKAKAAAAAAGGSGSTSSFAPTPVGGQGTIEAALASYSIPDGSYAHGELIRKGGKWTFAAGFRNFSLPVPMKSDISALVQKWVGSGISPAEGKMVEQWWRDHFVNGKIIAGSGSIEALLQTGKTLGTTLLSGITASMPTFGKTLSAQLTQQVSAAVLSAKQNLAGLTSTLAGSIGQIIDASLAGQILAGTSTTVGDAAAKIAKDAADKQQRGLQTTVDQAKAAALAGPTTLTDANGNPLTADAIAAQQATLNQAVTDAQNDLDDYLLQAKIDSATALNNVAKQNATDQINIWTQQFNQGIIDQQTFINDLGGLAGSYGDTGALLGQAFANSFGAQLDTIRQQVAAITSAGPTTDNPLLGNVVNPTDAIVQQAIAAMGTVSTDTTNITQAKAAIKAANSTYDSNVKRDRADATKLANDATVYTKQLAAAQAALDAANLSKEKDSATLALLRQLLQNAGVDPDTAIAAAAR